MREPANIGGLSMLNPDYMGFIFYEASKRFAGELDADALKVIPAGIKTTGVFVNASAEDILSTCSKYSFAAVQLHGNESPELCRTLRETGMEVIKAFGIDESFDFSLLDAYAGFVDYFLFDTKTTGHGGSGETFNWDILNHYSLNIPYFLSGGLSASNIYKTMEIEDDRFYALDLNSRFEISPGLKDIKLLESAINTIKHTPVKQKEL